MATYKEIKGTNIEVLASDPSNPVEGQVWFNSTDNELKGQAATSAGAWSTGGALNTARYVLGGGGSQTAAIAFGGAITPGPNSSALTELYNGTSWSEVNDLNTARERCSSAATTNTASLCIAGVVYPGGSTSNKTENWNGTNWAEVGDLSTARYDGGASGTSASALFAGGETSPGLTTATEEWSGSSTATKTISTD